MSRISTSDLHGYLIDERNLGSLAEIPATLYEEIHADILALYKQAAAHEDPFGEGAQSLLKERESPARIHPRSLCGQDAKNPRACPRSGKRRRNRPG